MDIVSTEKRSEMMSGIQGKDTKPEILIRKGLFRKGFRYHLHSKEVPGKPDILIKKWRTAIFVNGCFWHGHDCHLFKIPSTNVDFWSKKIYDNVHRDKKIVSDLKETNWRIAIVWECSIKGKKKLKFDDLIDQLISFIRSNRSIIEFRGVDIPSSRNTH